MFTSVKKYYKLLFAAACCITLLSAFLFAKTQYSNPDFGQTFQSRLDSFSCQCRCLGKIVDQSLFLCIILSPCVLQSQALFMIIRGRINCEIRQISLSTRPMTPISQITSPVLPMRHRPI